MFLTYPQCSLGKEVVRDCLIVKLREYELEGLIVAHELHADQQGDHLHVLVALKHVIEVTDPRFFDILGRHGNYKGVKRLEQAVAYITKGFDYVTWGTLSTLVTPAKQRKEKVSDAICRMINDEQKTLEEVHKAFPGFFMLHKKIITDYYYWVKQGLTKRPPWVPIPIQDCWQEPWKKIATWINSNVRKDRPHGTKQLYIWGPTGVGKSFLIEQLKIPLNVYPAPQTENFFDGLNESTDLVVFDEFHHQHKICFMNQFLDGSPMNLRVKGGQYHKDNNPPCIVVSNYSLRENYPKVTEDIFATIDRRFEKVYVDTRCPIVWLHESDL